MPQVHQIRDRFVNMYLIDEPAGLTLIDTGTPAGFAAVERAMQKLGRPLQALRRVIITHADPDHLGSAAALRAASGAIFYAAQAEAAAAAAGISSREPHGGPATQFLFSIMGRLMPNPPCPIDVILHPGETLPVLDGLQVLATPGHTPEHISLYAPAYRVLFAGDSLMAFGGKLSFSRSPVTWDYDVGMASIRAQAALDVQTVFCGHGPAIQNPVFPT